MGQKIEFKNLCQHQGQDRNSRLLFKQIQGIWSGPSVQVLMGTSGCGKSSLIKTLSGVWRPIEGQIFFDGEALWKFQGNTLNTNLLPKIGFSFQNNALFTSMRVIENLTFPYAQRNPNSTHEERTLLARDWLKKVELSASAQVFPHELSGGMQKRLGIARTLILKPDYIFLDDPTAGLDPITSKIMAALVKDLLKDSQALVIIVTNDPDRARDWGPHIHFLNNGTLSSPGSADHSRLSRDFL